MDNTYSKNSSSPPDPNSNDLQLPPQFTWPPSPIQAFAQPDLEYEHNTHRTPQHQPVTTPAHAEGHPSPTTGPGVILGLRCPPAVNSESSKATTTFSRTRVTDCHACRLTKARGQMSEAGRRAVTHKATSRGVECRLRGCLRLASLAEISAAGASRQPGAGRQQIALDEWGRATSPDLRSESPIHFQQVKSGGLTTLCSRRHAWGIVWSGDRRG